MSSANSTGSCNSIVAGLVLLLSFYSTYDLCIWIVSRKEANFSRDRIYKEGGNGEKTQVKNPRRSMHVDIIIIYNVLTATNITFI